MRSVTTNIVQPPERRRAVDVARQAAIEQALPKLRVVECRQLQGGERRGGAEPNRGPGLPVSVEQERAHGLPVGVLQCLFEFAVHSSPKWLRAKNTTGPP